MTSSSQQHSSGTKLSADTLALILAGLIAIAVVAGILPSVAW